MKTTDNIIELRNLKKCFEPDKPVIEDFNLIHAILVTIVIVAVAIAAHLYVAIQDATRTYDVGRSRRRWP